MTRRVASIAIAALLLAAGIYEAALRGLADVHYTRARLTLEPALLAKKPPRPQDIAAAQAELREAQSLEHSDPMYVEQAARLRELRALGLEPGDPAASAGFEAALAGYREGVRMRPGSPYAWASIALLKLRLGQIDAEFYKALDAASRLGPWESPVQVALADAGLAAWRDLTPPAKLTVIGALERGLRREEREIRRIAAAHGTLPLVCAEPSLPPRLAALCVKI
ncbi:MAG TPA: hypothetical protein VMT02_03050 [Burkholderiales bacterium]|jgi:hypothetical protein|nr:hypothetical protein [Burkholderiales bacterium]